MRILICAHSSVVDIGDAHKMGFSAFSQPKPKPKPKHNHKHNHKHKQKQKQK